MGICQAKTKNQKKNVLKDNCFNKKTSQMDLNINIESDFKNSQQSQLNYERYIGSPASVSVMFSRRRLTNNLNQKTTVQPSKSTKNLMEFMVQSNLFKKYSLIKNEPFYGNFKVMQNNKTGIKVEMEQILKDELKTTELVKWLIQFPVDHPNILKIIDIFEDQNSYQILYEYFDGKLISDIMKEEYKVTKIQIASIYEQMLKVIQFIHEQQLIHGNLKLNSFRIKIDSQQIQVKFYDLLGLKIQAQHLDNDSLMFQSPESLNHKIHKTKDSDLWAIGLIGYSLRKKKIPYKIKQNMNQKEIISLIQQHNFTFNKTNDLDYKSFLNSILAKDPKIRNTCQELLQHPFILQNQKPKVIPQIKLLQNLLNSKGCCLLQELILGYLLQEFNWDEYILIQKLFLEGDQDMDGLLNKQELLNLYKTYVKDQEEDNLKHQIDELFILFELNDKGGINNQHFQAMTVNRKTLLTKHNIEICFSIFANDKTEITLRGLKKNLNYDSSDLKEEFARLTNNFNTLSFSQFEKLLNLLL